MGASKRGSSSRFKLPKPKQIRIALIVLAALVVLGILTSGLALGGMFWFYGRDLEKIDGPALRNYQPAQVTRIYARDETTLIGEIYKERRTVVPLKIVPEFVQQAFMAAEDADFYHHRGMDYAGMTRALLANLRAGRFKQGASTITQQVVKNFILSPERSLRRKVQELILARRLELLLTKQEILGLYLNDVYFGSGAYGIQEAARRYFGVSVESLSLGQAAMLAGLLKAPSSANPNKNAKRARERQVYVLKQMVRHGFVTQKDIQPFLDGGLEAVKLVAPEDQFKVTQGAQEFVDAVSDRLKARFGEKELFTLGANVVTTVDLALQASARASVDQGLRALDERQSFGRAQVAAKPRARQSCLRRLAGPPVAKKIYRGLVSMAPAGVKLPEGSIALRVGQYWGVYSYPETGSRFDDPKLDWTKQLVENGILSVQLKAPKDPGSLPEGWYRATLPAAPEACAVLTEAKTGEVMAMVGGASYQRGEFNRVLLAKRQPGSSFKPFVYGTALASGHYTPATLVSDSPEIYEKWKPTNFESDVYRGELRLRRAITHSVNTIAIKLVDDLGAPAVIDFARKAGIESKIHPHLSMALGTSEVTMFELMRAYLTLARGGERIEPTLIRSIRDAGTGEDLMANEENRALQVLRADVVYLLTSMMESVVKQGTGRRALALGKPTAGKTGTSAENRDAWFAGFTPRFVSVAWVGYDTPKKIGPRETGGRAALPIWLEIMKAAEKDKAPLPFSPPPGVEARTIDARTGLLAPQALITANASRKRGSAPLVLTEYFLSGSAPMEYAPESGASAQDAVLDLYEE